MNMLNRNCKTSFAKPEFLKKAQRANPRLYDIGFYNDNLDLMLAPESDKTIRLDKESRSKLSDLIRPLDYDQLNNLYDLLVPQREKLPDLLIMKLPKSLFCKEKIKNDKSFKENQLNVFLKEREQYVEIQDLKSQLQDKGIAISELKKLIEKMKGKSVETKTRQPMAVPISTREPKHNVNQSVATSSKKTIATDSTVKKSRNISRKLYKQ
ncbi:hypothetical protein Tco_0956921, partial [Tanacetum coccineum]